MAAKNKTLDLPSVIDVLRERGMRITTARKRLIQSLLQAGRPLAIEAIHQQLGVKSIDLVTLYRNLSAFEEAGVLQVIRDEEGKALFEITNQHGGHHHHVICRSCGRIDCLHECHVQHFEKAATLMGYTDVSHRLELYGICKECQPMKSS